MSGVLEQILETLKRIEANQGKPVVAAAETASASTTPAAETPKRGRGRPAGSAAAAAPTPAVQPAAAVGGGDDDFLNDEPEQKAETFTKDQVREALISYNKKVNSQDKTRALLKEAGGVDALSALPEAKYGDVVKAVRKALA